MNIEIKGTNYCAYLFEASSIQNFVFATGKLRDASGASELLASIAREDLAESGMTCVGRFVDLWKEAGFRESSPYGNADYETGQTDTSVERGITVFRSAGGVIDICVAAAQQDALKKLRAAFRLLLAREAPGLSFVDAIGNGSTQEGARNNARASLNAQGPTGRSSAPPSSPIVRPSPLTDGAPEFWRDANDKNGTCKITGEYADASTLAKRQFLDRGGNQLARQFCEADAKPYKWPVTFEPDPSRKHDTVFPFVSELKRVALIHIDGNGVGKFYGDLPRGVDRRAVSVALAQSTLAATAFAMEPVLEVAREKHDMAVPARPILLGGDDVTLIVRADLALDFARSFATKFEEETRERFKDIPKTPRTGLTAKAGIVFLGPKQPFAQAYELCESLSDAARAEEARVSFWRLTGAMIPREHDEITVATSKVDGAARWSVWKPSWTWDEFSNLEELANLLASDEVGRGPLRRGPEALLSSRGFGGVSATEIYKRGLDVLGARAPRMRDELVSAMRALGVLNPEKGFATKDGYVPLLDAHMLVQIRKGGQI